MLNIIQLQDRLKGLPDSALQSAASMPGEHQILAMAELSERQRIRGAYANSQQQAQPTVMERLTAGGAIPEVRNQRPDMGALAAASNQGAMQPALGMATGGGVPSATEKVVVTEQRNREAEPDKQQGLNWNNILGKMMGQGAYKDSGGYLAPFRQAGVEAQDAYTQAVKDNQQANPYEAMLAAQEQDRARASQMENRDRWMALAQAGLATAGGASPNFLSNVASGAQAGLGALRQGMSDAEKRNLAIQARGDTLQGAGATIQGNNAQAMRAAAANNFNAENAYNQAAMAGSLGAYNNELQRDFTGTQAGLQRAHDATQGAANRASQMAQARLSASVQFAAQNMQRDLANIRMADEKKSQVSGAFADLTTRIGNMYKLGESPLNAKAAADAWTADARRLTEMYGLPAGLASAANNPFLAAASSAGPATPKPGSMTQAQFEKVYSPDNGGSRAAQE